MFENLLYEYKVSTSEMIQSRERKDNLEFRSELAVCVIKDDHRSIHNISTSFVTPYGLK